MTRFLTLPAGLAAICLAACGVAGAATIQSGAPLARAPEPLRCALVIRESGGMVAVEARLAAERAAEGSYSLRIIQRSAGGSSQVVQGGDFTARAGQRLTLGEASFAGRARDLAAALIVESGGRTIDCPAAASL